MFIFATPAAEPVSEGQSGLCCVTLFHQLHNKDNAEVLTIMNHYTEGTKLPRALENGLMGSGMVMVVKMQELALIADELADFLCPFYTYIFKLLMML